MRFFSYSFLAVLLSIGVACDGTHTATADDRADTTIGLTAESPLHGLLDPDPLLQLSALERIDREWQDYFAPALLEYVSISRIPALQQRAIQTLRLRTRQDFGFDINAWFAWVWRQKLDLPGEYADFKSALYRQIDPRFAVYFSAERQTDIRLDEIRWGGVRQDGIPPLRSPRMISADDADYLADDNVVFGIEVNGDFRAYPKRILAWHEMFTDTVGGIPVTGVYCTLCGSMILYESTAAGVEHEIGTSGFLYRSNKLMYDRATQSLWNTMWGKPVVGPLVGHDIRLPRRTVVTTTWGEWRRRHPATQVLSLATGHSRDYGEGVAYADYFATDELMFNTSEIDHRLDNKAEVLGLLPARGDAAPLAISAEFARANPLISEQLGDAAIIVVTDESGAMRAYAAGETRFVSWDGNRTLIDESGRQWTLFEDRLEASENSALPRIPSHSAFWFGWYGAYTNTRLLH